MENNHHTSIIRIGNSKGIRIPREFLKGLGEKVILQPVKEGFVVRPDKVGSVPPRKEWDAIFAKAIAAGEKPEKDVFEGIKNQTDDTEWE